MPVHTVGARLSGLSSVHDDSHMMSSRLRSLQFPFPYARLRPIEELQYEQTIQNLETRRTAERVAPVRQHSVLGIHDSWQKAVNSLTFLLELGSSISHCCKCYCSTDASCDIGPVLGTAYTAPESGGKDVYAYTTPLKRASSHYAYNLKSPRYT